MISVTPLLIMLLFAGSKGGRCNISLLSATLDPIKGANVHFNISLMATGFARLDKLHCLFVKKIMNLPSAT